MWLLCYYDWEGQFGLNTDFSIYAYTVTIHINPTMLIRKQNTRFGYVAQGPGWVHNCHRSLAPVITA